MKNMKDEKRRYMRTVDLEAALRGGNAFDEELVNSNPPESVHEMIWRNIERTGIKQSYIIYFLNVERSYGYQLLNGRRTPTREQIIKMGLLFGLGLDEMQRFLRAGRKEALYARDPFDARVIYAIEHFSDPNSAEEFIWRDE